MAQPNVRIVPIPAYPPRIFRCRVRDLRVKKGDSVKTVAAILGITPLTLTRIERGADLKMSHAFTLARYLNKKLEELWTLEQ